MFADATGDGDAGVGQRAALHGSDEAISPAGNVRDVTRTVLAITERLAQFGDVNPQTDFLDHEAGPRIGENFLLRNHLTRATYAAVAGYPLPVPNLTGTPFFSRSRVRSENGPNNTVSAS